MGNRHSRFNRAAKTAVRHTDFSDQRIIPEIATVQENITYRQLS